MPPLAPHSKAANRITPVGCRKQAVVAALLHLDRPVELALVFARPIALLRSHDVDPLRAAENHVAIIIAIRVLGDHVTIVGDKLDVVGKGDLRFLAAIVAAADGQGRITLGFRCGADLPNR